MFFFVENYSYLTYNLGRGEFMAIYWFVTFIILLIIEIVTINLVSIWFAIGAIASMINSIFIQLIVFIIVSLISLLITKPIIKKIKSKEIIPTNLDRVIGKSAIVTKEIKKDKYGEVKVLGSIWTACSDADIDLGEKVKVLSIEGVKLIVKIEEE